MLNVLYWVLLIAGTGTCLAGFLLGLNGGALHTTYIIMTVGAVSVFSAWGISFVVRYRKLR